MQESIESVISIVLVMWSLDLLSLDKFKMDSKPFIGPSVVLDTF